MVPRFVFCPDSSQEANLVRQAWRGVSGNREQVEVERLVKVRDKSPYPKSPIFRLVDGDRSRRSVIAKRARSETIALEASVYCNILPQLSLTAPNLHGSVNDGEHSWLFIDEVQGSPFDSDSDVHGRLAVEWLAAFHTGTRSLSLDGVFPDEDLPRHFEYVASARSRVARYLMQDVASDRVRVGLESVQGLLDDMTEAQAAIVERCGDSPRSLVHGDFGSKNVLVSDDELRIYVFDWETVGWGVPAIDLEYLDVDGYVRAVAGSCPTATREEVSFLKSVGVIVRAVGVLDSWAAGLSEDWSDHAAERVLMTSERLREGLAAMKVGSRGLQPTVLRGD